MNTHGSNTLTFWGASPIIFAITIIYTIPVVIINHIFKPSFEIDFIPQPILVIVAILLLCIGIPLYVITAKELQAAFKEGKLLTRGVFAISRNPLFAEVMLLLLPGIILFFRSWLLLTIPIVMYIMFKIFISREERCMEEVFGQEYVDYKNTTAALFPLTRKRRND
jgi:protein-S-isoprenylcysteine O-methyltransferase Ste14